MGLVNRIRGGSRAAAKSKMKRFVIIVNGFQLLTIIRKHFQPLTIITKHFQTLTIITKRSILDVAAVLDPPLRMDQAVANYRTGIQMKEWWWSPFARMHFLSM